MHRFQELNINMTGNLQQTCFVQLRCMDYLSLKLFFLPQVHESFHKYLKPLRSKL